MSVHVLTMLHPPYENSKNCQKYQTSNISNHVSPKDFFVSIPLALPPLDVVQKEADSQRGAFTFFNPGLAPNGPPRPPRQPTQRHRDLGTFEGTAHVNALGKQFASRHLNQSWKAHKGKPLHNLKRNNKTEKNRKTYTFASLYDLGLLVIDATSIWIDWQWSKDIINI